MLIRDVSKIFSFLWINVRCDVLVMRLERCGFNMNMSVKLYEELVVVRGKLFILFLDKNS